MQIDPRLNDVDDCLYRVAVRVLVVQDSKILLVKEKENWWAFPGGGINHGETVKSALVRELTEELGISTGAISSDFQIAQYDIGSVINGVPRMNLFFKASISEEQFRKTDHIIKWAWFSREEFLHSSLHPSYDKAKLINIIFGS